MRKVLHRVSECITGTPDAPLHTLEIILPHEVCKIMVREIDAAKARHRAIKQLIGRGTKQEVTFDVEFRPGMVRGDLLIVEYGDKDLQDGQRRIAKYNVIIDERKSSPMGTVYMRIVRERLL